MQVTLIIDQTIDTIATSSSPLAVSKAIILVLQSPNAAAVFAAHAQASDWLMPKLRLLELSNTALEPRRAHQRNIAEHRRSAGAVHAHSILLAISTLRSYFP
jgi:hypothetical protein